MNLLKSAFQKFKPSQSTKLFVLAIGAGLALTAILQNFQLNLFEAYLYDLRVRSRQHSTATEASKQIVLITIDERTTEKLNEFSPLSIKTHFELLNLIGQSKPKAIAYFINFTDSVSSGDPAADRFVRLADDFYTTGTPVVLGTEIDVTGEVVPPFPLSKLPHRVGILHKDGASFSEDKVTRKALFAIYDEPVLHVQLANLVNGKASAKDYKSIYPMPEIDANYFYINYSGPTQESKHGFTEISAIDLLEGKVSPIELKNKIILVGTKSKEDSSDFVYTPYSRTPFTNSKLVIHANIIKTLIENTAIKRMSKNFDLAITFLLTTLIIAMVFRTSPTNGVLFTGATAFALFIAGVLIFRFFNTWVCLAHPLFGIFFAYYVFVPYRLILEYKTRWQFQKRNEVLLQVEELKSNFMNLITHDLKTPVARIQGLAEILKRSGVEEQVVSQILGSTEELNRFITSILELAKIESHRMDLKKSSKDINKLIEDCVRKIEFQAKNKNITIDMDLEPLFPIKIDPVLMTKVINNLVDNAIKYSPVGARVVVESRESSEKAGFIEITVTDTGHGIAAKDLENLFSKFYRPKNDITIMTKGTGLGLYLSRYFVERHNGTLTVESVEGKGSMFTILLPMDDEIEETIPPKNSKRNSTQLDEGDLYV